MKSLNLFKALLLLSVFYLPMAIKQIDIAFPTGEPPKPNEYNYVKIWTDTSGCPSILMKLSASWSETMRVFDEVNIYYSNSYGFKKSFFNIYRDFKLEICGISPWPDKVILGENKWLFLGNSFANGIRESKGIDTFDLRQSAFIRNNFRNFESWRRKEGFAFYLAISPDKPTVYGEDLPIRKSSRPRKLDQVKKILSGLGIDIIDLKENFPVNKNIRLFHKTDTHWNSCGAFLGYQTLISKIKIDFPDIPVHKMDEYIIDSATWDQGDLSRMLMTKIPENWITMRAKYSINKTRNPDQFKVPDYFVGVIDDYEIRLENPERKYSILFFRDSFFSNMSDFFANDFNKELLIWDQMSRDIILKTKPDIVVYEVVEREIDIFSLLNY